MTITVTGDQGYTPYKPTGSAQDVDASSATFHMNQQTNAYPVQFKAFGPGQHFLGGKVLGEVDWTLGWNAAYAVGNSAAVYFADTKGAIAQDWYIEACWDGFRFTGGTLGTSVDWTVDNCWVQRGGDDGVEDDKNNGGTITNSLIETFSCLISNTSGQGDKTYWIRNTLYGSVLWQQDGKTTHGSPFKVPSSGPCPKFVVKDSTFAIRAVDHVGQGRLAQAFANMTVSGSYWLNLTDTPLPSSYPHIPAGFTLLQGQPARDMWAAKRQAWIDAFNGVVEPPPPPPPPPPPVEDGMEERIVALEAEFADLTAENAAKDETIAGLTSALASANSRLDTVAGRLSRLEEWAGSF